MAGISVRDENSFNIVSHLLGKDPVRVCDPVLLYGYERERARFKKIERSPYLLIYAYDNRMNDKKEVDAIKAYARANHLELVSPGFYHSWCDHNVNVDPIELLNYFACATGIITDTFHGSIMSILTHGTFAVIPRDNSNKLLNLLAEYGLEDRVIPSLDDISMILSSPIDYDLVEEELQKRRTDSMSYLDSMIQLCK